MIALKRILLVEDDAKDVELTLVALEEDRVANQVVVVRDGVEALDYLQARGQFAGRSDGAPAVVLLDMKMPRMGGLEVLRHVKADPHLKNVPIVMLTSSREEPDLRKPTNWGSRPTWSNRWNFSGSPTWSGRSAPSGPSSTNGRRI